MRRQFLLGHLLTVSIGGLIYISFRTETLLMFKWFDKLLLTDTIKQLRQLTIPYKEQLPNWVIYSLPDGLWLFSYVTLILYLWNNTVSRQNIFWLTFIPIIAIFTELGQFFGIVSGTFDIIDLSFYLIGTFLPIINFNNYLILKTKTI